MLNLSQLFVAQKRLADSAESAPSTESAPSWERVVQELSAMKPHFAECAKEAAEFAAAWSGGDDSPGLNEAEAYAKGLNARKEPADGQLGILANAQLKRSPRWPIACLNTLLQAPEMFCRSKGEAGMFTAADVKLMETRLNPEIMAASALMDKARQWLGPDLQSLPALTQKLMGDMEVRLVMHVHGFAKRVQTQKQYPSLEAIVQKFAKDVKDAGGDLSDCPWKLPEDASAESAPSAESAQPSVKPRAPMKGAPWAQTSATMKATPSGQAMDTPSENTSESPKASAWATS